MFSRSSCHLRFLWIPVAGCRGTRNAPLGILISAIDHFLKTTLRYRHRLRKYCKKGFFTCNSYARVPNHTNKALPHIVWLSRMNIFRRVVGDFLVLMSVSLCGCGAGARVRLPFAGACVWAAAGRRAQGEAICAGHHRQRPGTAADRTRLPRPLRPRLPRPRSPRPAGTPLRIHPCLMPFPAQQHPHPVSSSMFSVLSRFQSCVCLLYATHPTKRCIGPRRLTQGGLELELRLWRGNWRYFMAISSRGSIRVGMR